MKYYKMYAPDGTELEHIISEEGNIVMPADVPNAEILDSEEEFGGVVVSPPPEGEEFTFSGLSQEEQGILMGDEATIDSLASEPPE